MPATRTSTVKSSGGDYTTLAAWESAEQGVLTAAWGVAVSGVVGTYTAGETLNFTGSGATATFRTLVGGAMRFEVLTGTPAAADVITGVTSLATSTLDSVTYNDGEVRQAECHAMTDTTNVDISGATTDATRYRRVYAAPGAEAGMPWRASGAYILTTTGASCLSPSESYARVERLQLQSTHTGPRVLNFTATASVAERRAVGCHIRAPNNTATNGALCSTPAAGNVAYAINCVIDGGAGTAVVTNSGSGRLTYLYNCLVYRGNDGFAVNGDPVVKNCLAINCTTDFSGTNTAASTNNASEDATAPGAVALPERTFSLIDSAGGNYRLAINDVGARNVGADLSRDTVFPFNTDFDGKVRGPAGWDVGPFQTEMKHYRERPYTRTSIYKDRYPWMWTRGMPQRLAGAGGAATQTAIVGVPSIVVHSPAAQRTVGAVTRAVTPAPVVLHAPGVTTTTGSLTRVVTAASVVLHAPRPQVLQGVTFDIDVPTEQVASATSVAKPGPMVLHAPLPTVFGVSQTRVVTPGSVVVHAPRPTTTTGQVTRVVISAPVVLHAPRPVTTTGALTRGVASAPIILSAPPATPSMGAVTRAVGAAPVVLHAPLPSVLVVLGPLVQSGYVILHAPAVARAYSALVYPTPPMTVALDDLSTSVSLY